MKRLKALGVEKFTLDGRKFHTLTILCKIPTASTDNTARLVQFVRMAPSSSVARGQHRRTSPMNSASQYFESIWFWTRWPPLPGSPYWGSCEASGGPFQDSFSSHWLRHSFWRSWITEMRPSPAFRCTCRSSFSRWWTLLLGWCFPRQGTST